MSRPPVDPVERGLARARQLLGDVPPPTDGLDVLYFSSGSLADSLWINAHRVGVELARRHRVLFVEQPQRSLAGLLRLPTLRAARSRLHGITYVGGGLHVFSPLEVLPLCLSGRLARALNGPLTRCLIVSRVRHQLACLGFRRPVLWLYGGEQHPLVGSFGERLVVYDCVDEYTTFPWVTTEALRARIAADEQRLLRSADVVFAITPGLAVRKRRVNPHTYVVPNVGDTAHFGRVHREPLGVPREVSRIPRPRIGYVGAFARYRIDFALVDYLARQRPDWSFVMIGPVTDEAGEACLPRRPNLHWLGARDYEELPPHIAGFDACFLPYDLNRHTLNAFPLKFHEFLATGKPVVSTVLPALEEYADVVPLARTHEEFLSSLQQILTVDPPASRARRLAVAAANSWEHRVGRMTEIIRQHLGDDRS